MMEPIAEQIINDLHQMTGLPVDLELIFDHEANIYCQSDDYGDDFDGRIEYIPNEKIFIIYHPAKISNRVRFSIAHELGHYYIPNHRELLIEGNSHNSISGFISNKRLEREADEFAAHLLIPLSYLNELINRRRFLTLVDLLGEANKLKVSLMAMAIRYIKMTPDRCAIILSQDKKQLFYWPSEEMKYIGFSSRGRSDFPNDCATLEAREDPISYNKDGKAYNSSDWFSERKSEFDLWEEAHPLGYKNLVLTMLADRSYTGNF